jgi:ElaB/YqjD/DUF883 family membrane-anchored ribosome-binding protein
MNKENNVEQMYEDLKNKTEDITTKISDNAKNFESKCCNFVEKHPWQSLAISFGIGFLIAKLVKRDYNKND